MTTPNVKLSKYAQDQIIENAMNGAFEAEYKAIAKRKSAHAMACYRSVYSIEAEKAARRAPAEFLSMTNVFRIEYRDPDTKRRIGTLYDIEVGKPMPFHGQVNTGHLSTEDRDLYVNYRGITEDEDAIDTLRGELRQNIKQMVFSTQSLNKLMTIWPEVEQFLPADLRAQKVNLPAVLPEVLNTKLMSAGIKLKAPAKKASGGLVAVAA